MVLAAGMKHWRLLAGATALVAVVAAVQWSSGAYHSDFSADYDEAAHAVSSLLVRDYAAAGFPGNPLRFAESYYVHYPKVGIGHWPPLFYASEAVWMLAFGRSRAALLSFVGVAAAALLLSLFLWVARECGVVVGLAAALALAAAPFMQVAMYSASPNVLLALLALWAAMAYGRWLERGGIRYAVLFAVLAAACAGVHGRGIAVALVPLTGALLTGPRRMGRLLLAALVCAVFVLVPAWIGQADTVSMTAIARTSVRYIYRACVTMSWPAAILAVVGLLEAARGGVRRRRWVAMAALVAGGWWFHSLVNAGMSDYYLAAAAPGIAALFGLGLRVCLDRLRAPAWRPRLARAGIAALLAAVLVESAAAFERKPDIGFHRLRAGDIPGRAIFLIVGDPRYEGALIMEVALRDPGMQRVVLRGSKALASSTSEGLNYRLRMTRIEDVAKYLDEARVDTVFLQEGYLHPHARLLSESIGRANPEWKETGPAGKPAGVRMFVRNAALPPGVAHISVDIRNRVGKVLVLDR